MAEREQWGSRTGFILAAVGSAIGLGNIWRFPYVAYENGGGAFFVPYLVALLTAGIPLLVLEYAVGHRFRGSAPLTFFRLHRKAEWLGWWQVVIAFLIASYYAVIIAWAVAYTRFSFGGTWGDDPEAFLFEEYLAAADPGVLGSFRPGVLVPLVAIWVVTLVILSAGVRRGIERANKVVIPVLVGSFLVLVVRALTLPGATEGLESLFRPEWSRIASGEVWVAAYGQIFFSLSIAFAIMITYSSYLPERADLTNNAFIAGFSNASFELLAGLGVFAAVGFLAGAQGVGVEEVARDGIGLAFVVFPEIINQLPALNTLFGVLFFGSLVLAGLSSLVSITETYVAATQEKLGWGRQTAVVVAGGSSAVLSLLYATAGGINLLDVVDRFVNNFGVAVVGLAEVILIAWALRRIRDLQQHADVRSDLRLGWWWRVALTVVTPIGLGWMLVDNFLTELEGPYEGYPQAFINTFGWGAAGLALVLGVLATLLPWRGETIVGNPGDTGDTIDASGEGGRT